MSDLTAAVDAAAEVLRTMVGIADSTVAEVAAELTLTQFRALRIVTERTPVTMGTVAQALAVNPSSVTRACGRLAALGLLQRAQNPLNRREFLLAPTAKGRRVVARVEQVRREALSAVLERCPEGMRLGVAEAFAVFAAAAAAPVAPPGRG